ncbi:MAG: hypothetical protein O2931_00140 [Planctomycetota bacterium]|nr:hypothetical protein [Planctomycetota bacterium]MDA1177183.1 hypothetical protein [Planctomycetota bacterium]
MAANQGSCGYGGEYMSYGVTLQDVNARCTWRAWATPSVLVPVLTAVPLFVLGVAIGSPIGWCGAAALAGAGMVRGLYRMTWGRPALQQESLFLLQQEREQQHQNYVGELRQRLRNDRDPRTGDCAKRLQQLHRRLNQLMEQPDRRDQVVGWDDAWDEMRQLYYQCLKSLEQTAGLWETSQHVTGLVQREKILQSRNEIVKQVEQAVERLETGLDQWQHALSDPSGASQETMDQLGRLHHELEASLEVARSVDQRMLELENELSRRVDPLSAERGG